MYSFLAWFHYLLILMLGNSFLLFDQSSQLINENKNTSKNAGLLQSYTYGKQFIFMSLFHSFSFLTLSWDGLENKTFCTSPFSVAITKNLRMSNLQRKEVYLTHFLEAQRPKSMAQAMASWQECVQEGETLHEGGNRAQRRASLSLS